MHDSQILWNVEDTGVWWRLRRFANWLESCTWKLAVGIGEDMNLYGAPKTLDTSRIQGWDAVEGLHMIFCPGGSRNAPQDVGAWKDQWTSAWQRLIQSAGVAQMLAQWQRRASESCLCYTWMPSPQCLRMLVPKSAWPSGQTQKILSTMHFTAKQTLSWWHVREGS